MKITPLDLRKPDFKRAFKGYDVDEVRGMLASAADTLEEVLRENVDLKQRVAGLNERMKSYQNMESTLNETLIMAQKAGESARQASQREAELIVAKAEVEADRVLDAARSRLRELKYDIERMEEQKQGYLVKMRSMVASQWKLLQEEFEGNTGRPAEDVFAEEAEEPEPEREIPAEEALPEIVPEEEEDAQDDDPAPDEIPGSSAFDDDSFSRTLEEEAGRCDDSVKNLSQKLGEFLRSKDAPGDDYEGEALVAEEDLLDPEDQDSEALSWGKDDAEPKTDKPDLFWGQPAGDEDDDKTGGKGRGKK